MKETVTMMYVLYSEALSFVNQLEDKIKVVIFSVKDCPTCDDFLPHVFEPALQERINHFEWVYVDSESGDIPFPPTATPTAYFYIPNTVDPMPFFRVGGTLPSILHKDLDAMIKIKDTGITAAEAFGHTTTEVTSWVHRILR
jgi:hypothetical protein